MYAARYYAPRYYAPRYWPNVGAAVTSYDVGTQYLLVQVSDLQAMFAGDLDLALLSDDLAHLTADTAMGFSEAFSVAGVGPYYGIFDDESIELGAGIKDPPTILCAASSTETWQQGQAVIIRTLTYYIAGLQPDGVGLVRVVLEPPQ